MAKMAKKSIWAKKRVSKGTWMVGVNERVVPNNTFGQLNHKFQLLYNILNMKLRKWEHDNNNNLISKKAEAEAEFI